MMPDPLMGHNESSTPAKQLHMPIARTKSFTRNSFRAPSVNANLFMDEVRSSALREALDSSEDSSDGEESVEEWEEGKKEGKEQGGKTV